MVNLLHRIIRAAGFCAVAAIWTASAGILTAGPVKPEHATAQPGRDPQRIAVKFRDGLDVRLRNNRLASTNAAFDASRSGTFAPFALGHWERADSLAEEKIDQMRQQAEKRLGRKLPDLNLQFYFTVPAGTNAAAVIDALNQLDIVEMAEFAPRPAPLPIAPDYQPQQTYGNDSPAGGGAFNVGANYGVTGAGIQLADVEYSFNANHEDFPNVVNLDPGAVDPFNNNNHGTATLGEICALNNGSGTTGIAYGSAFFFAGADYTNGYDVGRGISTAAGQLRAGDVMLIEQQIGGPNYMYNNSEYGDVPVEWFKPYYDRIVMAAGLGIIVVEAGANGGQNLDDPIYSQGNGGHWPFLPQNNSGAVMVGAGASYNGSSTEGSRLGYANYGSRIDVQNWGENIVTTGFGDLYGAEGPNLYYTSTFSGTSGATPIVTGETILLEAISKNSTGQPLPASEVRRLLRNTGIPQTWGGYPLYDSIGPMPNLSLAVQLAQSNSGPPVILQCTTNVQAKVGGTASLNIAAGGAPPLTYQWKLNSTNLADGPSIFGSATAGLILNNLSGAQAGSYTVTVTNAHGSAAITMTLSFPPDGSVSPGVTFTNLYTFSGDTDGSAAIGITPDGMGNFYVVHEYGGDNGYGGIFEFTPATQSGTELYSFGDYDEGLYPVAALVLGSDGTFYGTTYSDDSYQAGTIFNFDPDYGLNPLYTFTGGLDGGKPYAKLVEGPNQVFYGTASSGGGTFNGFGFTPGYGVIFTVDAFGNYNVIHPFQYFDGSVPEGGLVMAGDGNFYGATQYGGAHGDGTIFQITPGGVFTNLYSFSGPDGSTPSDSLTVGLDGKLYGYTYYGGSNGLGTAYSITTNGVFLSLHSFSGPDGKNPRAALIAGNDGNLYGTTEYGGTNGNDGVLYEITPGGAFSIMAYFDGDRGLLPYASLARGENASFYGVTFDGAYGYGNIFQLSFASTPAPALAASQSSGGPVNFSWNSAPGRSYQLLATTNITQPNWTPAGPPLVATNSMATATDAPNGARIKFYKLDLILP